MTLVYCRECGEKISETAPTCPKCGANQKIGPKKITPKKKSKKLAGFLALLLGLGFHWFYLKNPTKGIIYLLCTIPGILFIIPWLVVGVLSIVDAIKFFTMTDEVFEEVYVNNN